MEETLALGCERRFSMNSLKEEMLRMVGRNKLVGIWAAEKLGLTGEDAKVYSDDLAMCALLTVAYAAIGIVILDRFLDAARRSATLSLT